MFGTEYPGRVVAPGRGQNNCGLRSIKKALQSLEKFWVDNVRKIAWIKGAGRTRRPLMRSQAASAVRAKAIPWPSIAASINMLARFRTGPGPTSAFKPAASNKRVQFFASSRRSRGNFKRSVAFVMRFRPATSFGLHTGKSRSEYSRSMCSPGQFPQPDPRHANAGLSDSHSNRKCAGHRRCLRPGPDKLTSPNWSDLADDSGQARLVARGRRG